MLYSLSGYFKLSLFAALFGPFAQLNFACLGGVQEKCRAKLELTVVYTLGRN